MGRAPCCDKEAKVKKGPWTPDEDLKLVAHIQEHGHGSWRALPEKAGLARCGKSCRLRWTNYLRPDIKRGRFSQEEEQTIFQLHAILGNRWSAIASRLPRRTDNEIKNYWNTHLKKRLNQVGIGPFSSSSSPNSASNLQELLTSSWTPLVPSRLTHMTQWDLTVAEAQARLRPKSSTEAQAPEKVHPSAFFMRSWKTEVEHTLRPKFGTVKLEPSLKSLGSNLQGPRSVVEAQSCVGGTVPMTEGLAGRDDIYSGSDLDGLDHVLSSGSVLGASEIGTVPMTEESGEGRSGSVLDGFAAQKFLLGLDTVIEDVCMGTEEDSGDGRSGICSGSVLGDHISPTSALHAPESYTDVHSPCGSTNTGTTSDCFDLILHQSSSYQKFPAILDQPEPSSTTADAFWERQQAALMEDLQPESLLLGDAGSESGLESIIPLDFDETEFPQFEQTRSCETIWIAIDEVERSQVMQGLDR